MGGSWIDPQNLPFNGLLDPSTGSSGLYIYTVDGGDCQDASASLAVVIDDCTSIQELDQIDLMITPNPAQDELVILTNELIEWEEILIVDLAGKQYEAHLLLNEAGKLVLDLGPAFSNGMYLLVLSNGDQVLATRFVVGR